MIGPGLRAYLTACLERMAANGMDLISISVGSVVTVRARRGELTVSWADSVDIIEGTRFPEQLAAHCVAVADRDLARSVPLP